MSLPSTQCYRAERERTYWDLILADDGPFRRELLTAESFCPFRYDFYQLMRNQLLAYCIESDASCSPVRVDFGVFYHEENQDLLQMQHSFGGEHHPLKAWPNLLKEPNRFHSFTVQGFLKSVEAEIPPSLLGWRAYLAQRYGL